MDKFLVNMAVVKVNWDDSQGDILDNYIPLIAYTLGQMKNKTVSVEEFKQKFQEVAEFIIPSGAIITLLKRAAKKYGYLTSGQSGTYEIDHKRINDNEFVRIRDAEQRKYNQLKDTFLDFCKDKINVELNRDEVDEYFFDVLFDIAPQLFSSVSDIDSVHLENAEQRKYLVSRFVSYANKADQVSFDAIISFVRGAMLTETFFYSHPSDIGNKMRKVEVFFDTQFLLRSLGYADSAIVTPCQELIDMLKVMSVKMRCFRHTYDEIHKILFAAASILRQRGRLKPNRPGDVFDYFNLSKSSASDIELELAKLEENLKNIGVLVEEKPDHYEKYSIDEVKLAEQIQREIPNQSEESRNHDVDSLSSIHRLRLGKPQDYLESCVAIFITTNAAISRASTQFFNREYGSSNAPVCMADQVFTTLIWLKAVKKAPDMPKDRLVATCYAATTPSEKLWEKYVAEAERLKKKGNIKEEDFAVLVHSLEARNKLMDLTLGENEIIQGTIEDVLKSAKEVYIAEVSEELDAERRKNSLQFSKINRIAKTIGEKVYKGIFFSFLVLWVFVLVFGLIKTSPDDLTIQKVFSLESWVFLVLIVITLLNLIFGFRVKDFCQNIAKWAGDRVTKLIMKSLSA